MVVAIVKLVGTANIYGSGHVWHVAVAMFGLSAGAGKLPVAMPFGVPELTSRGQLCAHHSSAMLIQHGPLIMRLRSSCPAQRTHPRRIQEESKCCAAQMYITCVLAEIEAAAAGSIAATPGNLMQSSCGLSAGRLDMVDRTLVNYQWSWQARAQQMHAIGAAPATAWSTRTLHHISCKVTWLVAGSLEGASNPSRVCTAPTPTSMKELSQVLFH